MTHANARTTVYIRGLIERFAAGWPAARIAEQFGLARATVYKWLHRFRDEGPAGLLDRSCRPHHQPTRTSPEVETQILALRRSSHRGHSGIRYEHPSPGDLLHVKKLGRVPDGGGWRLHGRREEVRGRSVHGRRIGYDYLHVAVDDHSRVAYVYRVGSRWSHACADLDIARRFTRPGCPWTNSKAERFNRTLQTEFAYAQPLAV
jgi:transposase InsO family protein